MGVILDADVVIRGEKGTFELHKWLATRPDDLFAIAAITVAELQHGLERATPEHKAKRERYLRTVLDWLPVIPYSEQTALEHARIWAKLESTGKMIGYYDMIVAATALERDCDVATFNVRHFAQVNGLRLIEPK